jgi:hypothetical protein
MTMKIVGVLLAIAGWLIPMLSLGFTSSNTARLVLSLLGIAVSIFGILGVLNKSYLREAIWKR